MPDGFSNGPDDEVDFRPLPVQSPQRKPSPQPRNPAGDGIDFQSETAARPSQRVAQPAGDGIDFRPAEKPASLESLYNTPQAGPSLAERAAHVGEPSPGVRAFAPEYADLTRVPHSPFTNRLQFDPPIATEEEARRNGSISPNPVDQTRWGTLARIGNRVVRALGAGAPEGSVMANITGERGTKDNLRLFAPEQLMTEAEQQRHPILTGAGEFAGGFTSPEGLTLLGLTAGAGELAGPGAQTLKRLLAAGFSGQMIFGAVQKVPAISQAIRTGDSYNAQRLLTQLVLETGTAGLAAHGAFEETAPATVPKGTISGKLAIDDATTRGARRMREFAGNEAARRGMSDLAEAERGIEADRQARINAPVQVPKTYEGEPPILRGPVQGPERNPLETEAERVREQRAAREPDFRVLDLRRVVPDDPQQPAYYELPPIDTPATSRLVTAPPAGETVGARARSVTTSKLGTSAIDESENSLLSRFGPDVLDEARQELQAAAGLASSFERPGRYFSAVGQTDEPFIREDPKAGIRHGGVWYGVGSARPDIEAMYPWYREIAEGPETLASRVQEGKGAAFDRMLEQAALHVQNERESARPVLEEYGAQLSSLAGQVRDTDPELAQTMLDLAEGRVRGFRNLREYVERTVSDGQRAAEFSRAIDEAAVEERESAGATETARPGGAARERESAETGELDFQPLPEPQPINPQEVEDLSRQLGRPITAEEIPEIRRRLDAERNIAEGLRGNRRDAVGEIRETHRTELDRQAAQGELGTTGERYSGISPRALMQGAQALQRVWSDRVARPFIDRVAKIGDKYVDARAADPAVAEGLHLLDNAPQYLRAKAAQEVHNIISSLSRPQERLFVLLADADSRENLRVNHPDEYAEAQRDPAVQAALRKYRPLEQELTQLRQRMGGQVLDRDYLRRVYDDYVAGIGNAEARGTPERGTSAFDRVIRPQRTDKVGREATAEYHYEHGLHEFGPSFATKFIGTHLKALRDQVAREFMGNATFVGTGASEPRFILYNGERYYRPDVAREMTSAGIKGVKVYDRYDPTAGEKFPLPTEGRFLGPRELVKTLNDFGRREESQPGALRRFFQEQILGFGFGVPHIFNIMRRVSQTAAGGAANPQGWLRAWTVALSKELRDRGVAGLNDSTFDMLAQRGAIPTGEMANLKEYWGGNLNPANWLRKMAGVGHKALFEPSSFGSFGGLDPRARLYIADLVKSQRPELSDTEIARAVRDQLGDYNRANWSDRQKLLAKFMMFPGWDASSIRWVIQHPIKTTVPPALVVLLANQALNQLGKNRPDDRFDVQNIHISDRAYGSSLVRESVARNLFRPALSYAQAKIRGENDQRAMAEAARGVTAGAGGLLSMLRPDLSGFLALATNRQALFSGKEIISKDDFSQPGKLLPSRAVEKEAVFALRHAVPALDRMLDANEETDWRSFAGGNLGTPNFRDDAEKRLLRNAAEAEEVHRTITKLAKSNPELARQYVRDPDNAAFALFYHDLSGLTATLKRMDEAKERIESSGLPADDKKARIATIEKARENLLRHADGLSNLLFERRQRPKSSGGPSPDWMLRVLRSRAGAEARP